MRSFRVFLSPLTIRHPYPGLEDTVVASHRVNRKRHSYMLLPKLYTCVLMGLLQLGVFCFAEDAEGGFRC